MGADTSAQDAAMRKQQEQLDRMTEEEKRKNKLAQQKSLRNMRTATGGTSGFDDSGTLG